MNSLSSRAPAARLDASLTVNDVLARHPQAGAVFNAFGIDTCCGGGRSLADAAREDGCSADALLAALADAIARG